MRIVSLFDGCGGARLALHNLGITDIEYYASEVDKYAMIIANKNFPDIWQVGDVEKISGHDFESPNLLIGGSPCQGLSNAGKQLGFDDPRSKLFWEYVRVYHELEPDYFLLENVASMKQIDQDIITEALGVEPVMINSSLLTAQNRKRLYWANFTINQPEDAGILLKDVVFNDAFPVVLHNLYGGFKEKSVRVFRGKSPTIRTSGGGGHIPSFVLEELIHSKEAIEYMNRRVKDGRNHWDFAHHSDVQDNKSSAVVANFFKGVPYNVFKDWKVIRKFHPIECERLQGMPDNYTEGVSNTQRYKMIGNGFTIPVIEHILKEII